MAACDAVSGCNSFSYVYNGGEPGIGNTNTNAYCYLKTGPQLARTANSRVGLAVLAAVASGSPTSTLLELEAPIRTGISANSVVSHDDDDNIRKHNCGVHINPLAKRANLPRRRFENFPRHVWVKL